MNDAAAHPSSFILPPSSRILVLRLSALGDVIHTLPAVATLGGDVSWVVEAPYAELVETVAGVHAIPVRLKKWSRAPLQSRADMRAARRAMRGFDVSIDFQGLIKSAAIGALARAPIRYGFEKDAVREKASLLFTNRRIAVDTSAHVVDQNLQLARATGNGQRTTNWAAFADDGKSEPGAIVILPGAGRPEKLWSPARFRELAARLGPRAVVVWGPGEEPLADAIGIRKAPPTNLRELAGILRNARLVIGADTGPLHLAAALGTKVVGLYGPTNPRRNGPYGQLRHCVDKFGTTGTMDSITVEDVMAKVGEVD